MDDHKKYKVTISDRAKRMLGTHMRFPFFQEMYIMPNKYHKMFVGKWYIILYQIQDDMVEYILDCRRDYSWLLHE
ncbi:MAG: hypothetical protein HFI32_08820 [Lachnospiraceae bacterium]|nr:hypothetical protein [Lachnospiraceae bacterium]